MPKQTRITLKGYFEVGDIPTQGNYHDLIDSFVSLSDTDVQHIQGDISSSGNLFIGNITSSGTVSASGDLINTGNIVTGHITASGGISSSLTIKGDRILGNTFFGENLGDAIQVSGSQRVIYLKPTDFFPDNSARGQGAMGLGGGFIQDDGNRLIFMAQKFIPKGHKATGAIVYGDNTSDTFFAASSSIAVESTSTVLTSTNVGTLASFSTNIQHVPDIGVYVTIHWASRGSSKCYGGYIELDGDL